MDKEDNKQLNIDDNEDIQRHLLSIHTDSLTKILTNDLIVAKLDEKERKYVADQVCLAHEAKFLIKDGKQRDYAVSRLLLKAVSVAVLKRNVEGNQLIELLLKKKEEQTMSMPDGNMDQEMMRKLEEMKKEKQ